MVRQTVNEPRRVRRVRPALVIAVLMLGAPTARGAEVERNEPREPGGKWAADRSAKPAWQWSVEERLAVRFDSEVREARAAKRTAEQRELFRRFPQLEAEFRNETKGQLPRTDTDTIDGKDTPELFLTWELFNALLDRGFPPGGRLQAESRRRIEARAAAIGFGRDLWEKLAKASAPYLQLRIEGERSAASKNSRANSQESLEMDEYAIGLCRARADAITAAKAEFGEEPFLRLLYEGVAPSLNITYILKEGLSDHMRYLEGGCR